MDHPLTERRRDARFQQPWIDTARATLRPGCPVVLVDLSAGGALVEAQRPLRPGARVHVQIVAGTRRLALSAVVIRCAVWSVDRDDGVRYRGALRFEHRCELFGDRQAGSALPPGDGADDAGQGTRNSQAT